MSDRWLAALALLLTGPACAGALIFEEWGTVYTARFGGASVRLDSSGIEYAFSSGAVTMRASGARPWKWSVADALEARLHVFNADGVRHHRLATRVVARDVYSGVDVVARGGGPAFEYDLVVHPGADPNRIAFRFIGARRVRLVSGELWIERGTETLRQRAPVAFQEMNGRRLPVQARYRMHNGEVRIATGTYDPSRPLIIDPVVLWASGGPQRRGLSHVTVGRDGSIYAVGSAEFATQDYTSRFGPEDTFGYSVVKLKPGGAEIAYLAYVTGPTAFSVRAFAVDAGGSAYVAGWTTSTRYPTTPGAFQTSPGDLRRGVVGDGFLTKLSPDGSSLVYSTLLGGESDDSITGIAVDEQGNAYVTGTTASSNFPTTKGTWRSEFEQVYRESDHSYWGGSDSFLLQFDSTGSTVVRSTVGLHLLFPLLARDGAGDLYVAGRPWFGFDRAVSDGARAAVGAMKFTADLSRRLWVTGVGESAAGVEFRSIAVDGEGHLIIGGFTPDPRFPATEGAFQPALRVPATPPLRGNPPDGFVLKLLPDGSGLAFSTFLGGTAGDWILGVAPGEGGAVHVAGVTASADFPVTADALQPRLGGGVIQGQISGDGFYARLSADGSRLETATYMGNTNPFESLDSVSLDPAGAVYLSGLAGGPVSQQLSGPPAWQGGSAALVKLGAEGGPEPRIVELAPDRVPAGVAALELRVAGEGFRPDAVLLIADARIAPAAVSGNLLEARVPPELLDRVRTLDVRVINPGLGVSNTLELAVERGDGGKPYLRAIAPTGASFGSAGLRVTLSGSGFDNASAVLWKGEPRTAESVSETEAAFSLAADDLREPGSFPVALRSGTGDSNELPFVVSGEPPESVAPILARFAAEAAQGSAERKVTLEVRSPSVAATVDGEKRPLAPGFLDREWDMVFTADDHLTAGMREIKLVDEATGKTSNPQPYLVYLPLETGFLAYNAPRKLLYAITIQRTSPEDFLILDGKDFKRLGAVELRAQARPLVSGDGRFLYVPTAVASGPPRWARFETLGEAPWLRPAGDFLQSTGLGVIPGQPDTVMVARTQGGDLVLEVFDGANRRPQSLTLPGKAFQRFEVHPIDASAVLVLFGAEGEYRRDVVRVTLGPEGVQRSEAVANGVWAGIEQASLAGRLYTRSGQVLETERLTTVARLPQAVRGPVAVGGRIAFVADTRGAACLLAVFDPETLRPDWSIFGGSACYNPGDLVALDENRFAWTGFAKGIYIVRKPSAFSYPELEIAERPGDAVTRIDLVREVGVTETLYYYLWARRQPVPLQPLLVQKEGAAGIEDPIKPFPAGAPGALSLLVTASAAPGSWSGDLHLTVPNAVAPVKTIPVSLETVPIYPLRAEPASVEFQMKASGTAPAASRVRLSKDGASYRVDYSIAYTSAQRDWLAVRYVERYQTPLELEFAVAGASPGAGVHTANVRLRIFGGPELTVPVTLRVE